MVKEAPILLGFSVIPCCGSCGYWGLKLKTLTLQNGWFCAPFIPASRYICHGQCSHQKACRAFEYVEHITGDIVVEVSRLPVTGVNWSHHFFGGRLPKTVGMTKTEKRSMDHVAFVSGQKDVA